MLMSIYKQEDLQVYTKKSTTTGYTTAVGKFSSKDTELLVGTHRGHLSKFRITSDLISDSEKLFIHGDEIVGIGTSENGQFLTCSRDKTCLLWDIRNFPKAKVLQLNFENELTAMNWNEQTNCLLLGDECGNLLKIDVRSPAKIVEEISVSNREITSIVTNDEKVLGITSKSNVVKILDDSLKTLFEHKSDGIIYSMLWDTKDVTQFYIVGERQLIKKLNYH